MEEVSMDDDDEEEEEDYIIADVDDEDYDDDDDDEEKGEADVIERAPPPADDGCHYTRCCHCAKKIKYWFGCYGKPMADPDPFSYTVCATCPGPIKSS